MQAIKKKRNLSTSVSESLLSMNKFCLTPFDPCPVWFDFELRWSNKGKSRIIFDNFDIKY